MTERPVDFTQIHTYLLITTCQFQQFVCYTKILMCGEDSTHWVYSHTYIPNYIWVTHLTPSHPIYFCLIPQANTKSNNKHSFFVSHTMWSRKIVLKYNLRVQSFRFSFLFVMVYSVENTQLPCVVENIVVNFRYRPSLPDFYQVLLRT